tara:strand:+ start:38 stop:343 length:306 start_codon:yes stop_codon:yes gene_type:complete
MAWHEDNHPDISWAIERTDPNRGGWTISSKKYKYDNKKEFSVRFCSNCNYAWEFVRNYSKKAELSIKKYIDFPKKGLIKLDCPTCNTETQHKGTRVICQIK